MSSTQRYFERVILIVIQFFLLATFIRFFVLSPALVNGQSMENTLFDNNFILVNKMIYIVHAPERFDVVQAISPNSPDVLLVKRIIGLPGESIIFRERKVFIRNQLGDEYELLEPYLPEGEETIFKEGQAREFLIPEDHYFIMGDNRNFSTDSRKFGPIHRRLVNGLVLKIE
ncbi:signal peptidase I [Patescibacteria group bacterium]|nr:signal peptidase I [Patescibacteria group bacterium]